MPKRLPLALAHMKDPQILPRSLGVLAGCLALALALALVMAPNAGASAGPRSSPSQDGGSGEVETFNGMAEGRHDVLETLLGKISGPGRSLRVLRRLDGDPGDFAVRLGAPRDGQKMPTIEIRMDLAKPALEGALLSMDIQRAARRKRFRLEAELRGGGREGQRVNLTPELVLTEFRRIDLVLPAGTMSVVFHLTAPPTVGVDIDNLSLRRPGPMQVTGANGRYVTEPACISRTGGSVPLSALADVEIVTDGALRPRVLQSMRARVTARGAVVHSLRLVDGDGQQLADSVDPDPEGWWAFEPGSSLHHGVNRFRLEAMFGAAPGGTADSSSVAGAYQALPGRPCSVEVDVAVSGEAKRTVLISGTPPRTAHMFGSLSQGLEGTALLALRGTAKEPTTLLGAVTQKVDGRRSLALLRSDSSGQLAPPMRPDLGLDSEWDIYAPTLIRDRPLGFVHLYFMVDGPGGAGMWRSVSEDLGLSWGKATPVQWALESAGAAEGTPQHRPAGLRLLGGRGVASSRGLWALLAKDPDEVGHRLLVSKDRGETFSLSTCTEVPAEGGALCELGPGGLLLDAHLPGSGRRYLVASTTFGEQWTTSLSKRRPLLNCSGAGAALIHVGQDLYGAPDYRLLFSNVAEGLGAPEGLTVRGSNDNGDNWFDRVSLLLDAGEGADLPALGVLDDATVCVLYQSSHGDLCVQYIEFPAVIEKLMTFYDVFGAGSGLKR